MPCPPGRTHPGQLGTHRPPRLCRGGNRPLNAAIHRIAITQTRCHHDARVYLERRTTTGNTRSEALRALKRRLSDVVYRALLTDTQSPTTTTNPSHPDLTHAP